jgi:hypothetical protein
MRRVLVMLFAVVVLAGLLFFSGALARGLTMGAMFMGLTWWGLVRPYAAKRKVMNDVSARAFRGLPGIPNEQTWLVADVLDSNDAFHDDICGLACRATDAHDLGRLIRAYAAAHLGPELAGDLTVVDWDAVGALWSARAGEARRTQG